MLYVFILIFSAFMHLYEFTDDIAEYANKYNSNSCDNKTS